MPTPSLVPLFEQFDRIERQAVTAKTLLARRVDESREWARRGYASAAEYLAAKTGSSVGAAKDALATSTKVTELPVVEQAMRDGELSGQQAVLVADAAAAAPGQQSRLVNEAKKSSHKELKDECQRTKAAADSDRDATHKRIHDERYLRTFTDKEGAWNLRARGTADAGARIEAALRPFIDEQFAKARGEGASRRPPGVPRRLRLRRSRRARRPARRDQHHQGQGPSQASASGPAAHRPRSLASR